VAYLLICFLEALDLGLNSLDVKRSACLKTLTSSSFCALLSGRLQQPFLFLYKTKYQERR
jgi:hypothetical protein